MMAERWDILVVGAGPAGASAAFAAATRGVRVVMAEQRKTVGVPVRCAEYIPAPLVGMVELPSDCVVQRGEGMRTILPDGTIKPMRAPGFTIRRDRFDQFLADAARKAGARLMTQTRVVQKKHDGVLVKDAAGTYRIFVPKVIIGADGPHTTVGKWIGSVNRTLMPAVQYRVALTRPMDMTEVYFDPEIYGGYGWLFPKGKEANVGLGILRSATRKDSIRKRLDRFVLRLKSEGKIEDTPLAAAAGWIPVAPPRRVVRGNIVLAGDAAGHTHPITGAGIFHAVVCGRMAGKWAAEAVRSNDPARLQGYEAEWRDLLEETLQRASARRRLLEKNWGRLGEILPRCWVAFKDYYERSA